MDFSDLDKFPHIGSKMKLAIFVLALGGAIVASTQGEPLPSLDLPTALGQGLPSLPKKLDDREDTAGK